MSIHIRGDQVLAASQLKPLAADVCEGGKRRPALLAAYRAVAVRQGDHLLALKPDCATGATSAALVPIMFKRKAGTRETLKPRWASFL